MSIIRKLYLLGFAIYIFSFFLPAIPVLNEPISGYESALWLFGALFEFKGLINYSFTVFANLANILTILVFILQFSVPFKKLIIFQLIAFISAFFWVGFDLIEEKDLSNLYIGYWNWLFGIFFMLISMFASIRVEKKLMDCSQQGHPR